MAAAKKVAHKTRIVGVDPQDFSPSLLRVQSQPPAPFARAMLHLLLVLLFTLILWTAFGKLDIVATAEGKLIPQTCVMQVTAEIHLGTRTILEYLLSPVTGAF